MKLINAKSPNTQGAMKILPDKWGGHIDRGSVITGLFLSDYFEEEVV